MPTLPSGGPLRCLVDSMGRAHRTLKRLAVVGLASASLAFAPAVTQGVRADETPATQKVKVSVTSPTSKQEPQATPFTATLKSPAPTHKTVRLFEANGQTYLSLKDLAVLLDFALDVTPAKATGFFFHPQNTFDLNLADQAVSIRNHRAVLSPEAVRFANNELYISSLSLLDWFDVSALIERERNTVHFSTPNLLPAEARAARARKRQTLLAAAPDTPPAAEMREIQGSTGAGYEVELYENGKLIAAQNADATGTYRFTNVPVPKGETLLRLALFGPQGQTEERTQTLALGPAAPPSPTPAPPLKADKEEPRKATVTPPLAEKPPQSGMATPPQNTQPLLLAKNWRTFELRRGGEDTGKIEAYVGARGVFIRLDSFARALNIIPAQQTSPDVIELNLAADHHILLDVAKHSYVTQGQHYTLHDQEAFKNEDKIYVHESLLHKLFDRVPFTVDQALGRIKLPEAEKKTEPAPPPAPATDKADLAPPPAAAPVTPVIIDDLASQQRSAEQKPAPSPESFEAHDVLHIEQTKSAEASAKDDEPDNKAGEPLVLQPRLKNNAPSGEFIEALDFSTQVFLPLNDLVQYFEFPIKIEGGNRASGYFFAPENDFVFDLNSKELRIAGRRLDLSRRDVRQIKGQVYISTEALTSWFGIACTLDRNQGSIHFETERLFPKEEQEQRQKRWSRLLRETQGQTDADFPTLKNDYAPVGYPSLDVSLSTSYAHQSQKAAQSTTPGPLTGNYNIQGSQELGYLTSQFYAQGSSTTKSLDNARFVAGRADPAGNLLGGLHATSFAVGDVTSPSLSFVTSNALGRGATITNRNENTSENFDVRSFSGDSVPGYEVELYRNNALLGFQTVDANGRYSFKDIPILYGENTFRLVFYGPQGQREERVETVSAASALLKEGQFEYTLGALQRGFGLLPTTTHESTNINAPNGNQYVGGFRYGLTSNYSFGAAVAETLLADGPHRYLTTSSGSSLFGVLSETSYARDMTTGGWASGVSVLGGFSDISLRGRYRRFNNFISESVNSQDVPRTSEARLEANSQIYVPLLQEFSAGLGALRETFVNTDLVPRYTYDFRLSKSLWGLSFTNDINYIIDSERRVQDVFGVQTRLWDINFRTTGVYDLKPDQQFRTASVMADYKLDDRLSGQTQLERDMASGQTSVNQNINWDFDKFRLSLNNSTNTKGDYTVGLNVLFSLSHDEINNRWRMNPQQVTGGGAIAGRVFIDENNNGIFDDGEKIVPDAGIRVNRAAVKLDENGYFASPVTPYQPSKVEVSLGNLSDPLLTPKTRGYQVITRPGDTVIADFPLVHTTIIDGNTFFLEEDGSKRELGNIVIELQDADGKPMRRILSEVDGYYNFDKVPAGDYWISVPDEVLDSMNATLKNKIHVSFAEVKEFMTGNDIILEQKTKLNGPPAFAAPQPAAPPPSSPPPPTPPTLPRQLQEERTVKKDGNDDPKDLPDPKTEKNSAGQDESAP